MKLHSKMKRPFFYTTLFIFNFLLFCTPATAQADSEIEMLLQKHSKRDTARVSLLNERALELYHVDFEQMFSLAEEAVELSRKLQFPEGEAESLRILGMYYYSKSENQEAAEYFDRALKLFTEEENRKGISRCLNYAGRVSWKMGDYELARERFQAAHEIALELKDKDLISQSLSSLGILELQLGNYEKAKGFFEESMQLAEEIGDKRVLISNLHNIGYIHSRQGNYPEAIEYYQKTIEILEEINDRKEIAGSLLNIGIIYQNQGDYARAIENYQEAQGLYEEFGEKVGASMCMNNIGLIHQTQGNYPLALEYIQNSLEIKEESGDKRGISSCMMNIGTIYMDQENFQEALNYFQNSLEILEQLQDKNGISNCLMYIGSAYRQEGKRSRALEFLSSSLEIKEEIGDKAGISTLWMQMGEIYLTDHNYTRALEYTNRSLEIARDLQLMDNLSKIYKQLSDIYSARQDYRRALEYYVLYKELYDSTFSDEQIRKIASLELQFHYEKEKQALELEQQKKDALREEEMKLQKVLRNFFIGGFILMAILAFVILLNFRQKRKANLVLEQQKKEIELQKNKITDSISYARRIQHAMFPPEELVHRLLKDSFVLHKPRDIVSGDFFWIAEKEGKVVIAVADCTGHGVPGAFMSLLGITFLNEIVNAGPLRCTSDILNSLREKVIQSLRQTGKVDEARDGMEVALCILETEKGNLQFSGANRPLLLSRKGEIQETKPDRMPIGIYEENRPFCCHELNVEPGDCIYLFSDGYKDQIGGPHKKSFKSKYFRKLLAGIHDMPIQEQQLILEETLKDWRGSFEQIDDILVFGCRI